MASIEYKDESELLKNADDVDSIYMEDILPEKMKWNMEYISKFSFGFDISVMIKTVIAVFGKA